MTELEKIAYAKSFIDKLANGINPLDDTNIPDDDITNNVRVSRCFFYVSDILRQVYERGGVAKLKRAYKSPFAISPEQLEKFEYSADPISSTAMARKINWLVRDDIDEKRIKKLSYRSIIQWLINIGMIEYREWENGKSKRFPTADGEEIGLVLSIWEKDGRRTPVIYFNVEAQRFIIDNIDAVIATEVKKGKASYPSGKDNEEDDD